MLQHFSILTYNRLILQLKLVNSHVHVFHTLAVSQASRKGFGWGWAAGKLARTWRSHRNRYLAWNHNLECHIRSRVPVQVTDQYFLVVGVMSGLGACYENFLLFRLLVYVLNKVNGARTYQLVLTEKADLWDVWKECLSGWVKLEARAHGEPITELWFDNG